MKIRTLAFLLGVIGTAAHAQSPHVVGTLSVDPPAGLIDGRLCTAGFSPRRDVRFLLNAGLNVRGVTAGDSIELEYRGEARGRTIAESREYVLVRDSVSPPLRSLCVSYRGAVPVFRSNTAVSDWKGRIVAIAGTLRAAEQTHWYPTLFDSTSGIDEQSVSYDLSVECPTCEAIYLNGSPPVRGTSGRFVSTTPRQLMLYAGRTEFTHSPSLTFIGAPAGDSALAAFERLVAELRTHYERIMGMPYRDNPALLSFQSVSRDRPPGRNTWQFVTWPTIAMDGGVPFDSLLRRHDGRSAIDRGLANTFAHEMGHYYFGTLMRPRGPLRWIGLESTAEYLALRALEATQGTRALAARLVQLAAGLSAAPAPIDRIVAEDEVDGGIRYQFAPLYLRVLEARSGADRMDQFLRNLVRLGETPLLDYASFSGAAVAAGVEHTLLRSLWNIDTVRTFAVRAGVAALDATADASLDTTASISMAASLVNLDSAGSGLGTIRRYLRRLVAADSGLSAALYQIGKIGALSGEDAAEARRALEAYLRRPVRAGQPTHANAWLRIGMIEERRNQREAAREAYRAALAIEPSYAQARAALTALDARTNRRGRGRPRP